MKDYKNTSGTKILLLFSLAFYTLLPPLLTAVVFNRFNLNPFAIVKFFHFNPFWPIGAYPAIRLSSTC